MDQEEEEQRIPTAKAATPISRAFLGASPPRSNAWLHAIGAYLGGLAIIVSVVWILARLLQYIF